MIHVLLLAEARGWLIAYCSGAALALNRSRASVSPRPDPTNPLTRSGRFGMLWTKLLPFSFRSLKAQSLGISFTSNSKFRSLTSPGY